MKAATLFASLKIPLSIKLQFRDKNAVKGTILYIYECFWGEAHKSNSSRWIACKLAPLHPPPQPTQILNPPLPLAHVTNAMTGREVNIFVYLPVL